MDKIISWLKQPQVWGFFLSMAILVIISLAFFFPDNFEGNSLMQSDMQQGAANGQEAVKYEEATGIKALWTNSLMSGMPTFQISPSYPSNSLFSWLNTLYGLGLPNPSNLLFMMMFGFLILLYCMKIRWWAALLGAIAWGFSSYFVIIIGAGHIWKFVTLAYIPPTIGGLVLCYQKKRWILGGALTALFAMLQLNANHPQMTYYFAFVMAAFSIAYLLKLITQNRLKDWIKGTITLIIAGILAVGANLPSLYNTYEYAKETKRSQSELTIDSAEDSEATSERPTGGLSKAEIINWSYGKEEMFSLLIPNIKGGASARPEKGQMQPLTLDRLESSSTVPSDTQAFLPFFTQYFNDSEGTNGPVYVGAIIFALFILGCIVVRGPMKWALLFLTVFSILLALGRNFSVLTDFMIYNFPMYSKFRAVESILVIAEFTIPLLAILGLVKFLDNNTDIKENKTKNTALYISFGICAFVCLLAWIWPSIFGSAITSQDMNTLSAIGEQYSQYVNPQRLASTVNDLRYGMLRDDAIRSLIFLALGFGILWLQQHKKISTGVMIPCLIALVIIDLYTVDKRYISTDCFATRNPFAAAQYDPFQPDAIDQLILRDQDPHYRVMDIPGFGSATRSYHHHMIGGYHAAKLNRYEDLIQRRMMYATNLPRIASMLGTENTNDIIDLVSVPDSILEQYPEQLQEIVYGLEADLRVLDMLNTKYIITGDKDQPVILNPDALGNAWLISNIRYVKNANEEMDALEDIDPSHEAVADEKFHSILQDLKSEPAANDTIYLTSYSPNELKYEVSTANGGIAVFSEIYFPWGWHATIDGKKADLGRVNYVLRAMRVPAGKHNINMIFDPQSLHATGSIAYACVTLIYLWLIGGVWLAVMRKEESDNSENN